MTEPNTAHLFLSDEDTARCMADRHELGCTLGPGELPAESYWQGHFDRFHGVSRLPDGRFKSDLGLGSAQGGDSLAIIDRIDELAIAEPSQRLRSHRIGGLQPRYVDPSSDTTLPFPDVLPKGAVPHPEGVEPVYELSRVVPDAQLFVLEPVESLDS
jgi:hypothetical protein